jgi:hypothetical protein
MRLGEVKAIALDPSAAIVLTWLGLLPKVLNSYPRAVLPASTLSELFEGYSRIRKFQKSQITRAEEVLAAIGNRGLKVHHSPAAVRDPLAREAGPSFVSLLRGAEGVDGYVVQPAPLKRIGLEHNDDVDVSGFGQRLVDVPGILDALAAEGVIDEVTEETARRYLTVQDKRWPNRPALTKATPLFLDDLALHYLQAVDLLDPMLRFFENVTIDKFTEDHARAVKQSVEDSATIVGVIQELRMEVHKAWSAGKLAFGPHYQRAAEGDDADEDGRADVATIHLLADLMEVDVTVIDDRALNKEAFIVDRKGHRAHIATTLDILEDLHARGSISDVERRTLRHKLRGSGALLVPVTVDEIVWAALRSKNKESAELRAVRESLSLARTTRIPKFPGEIPWFAQATLALKQAIPRLWEEEPDKARAERLATAILALRLRPAEWLKQWEVASPPQWGDEIDAVIAAALAVPVQLSDEAKLDAYHMWVERNLLGPMRELSPGTYEKVVEKVRALLLLEPADRGDDDG